MSGSSEQDSLNEYVQAAQSLNEAWGETTELLIDLLSKSPVELPTPSPDITILQLPYHPQLESYKHELKNVRSALNKRLKSIKRAATWGISYREQHGLFHMRCLVDDESMDDDEICDPETCIWCLGRLRPSHCEQYITWIDLIISGIDKALQHQPQNSSLPSRHPITDNDIPSPQPPPLPQQHSQSDQPPVLSHTNSSGNRSDNNDHRLYTRKMSTSSTGSNTEHVKLDPSPMRQSSVSASSCGLTDPYTTISPSSESSHSNIISPHRHPSSASSLASFLPQQHPSSSSSSSALSTTADTSSSSSSLLSSENDTLKRKLKQSESIISQLNQDIIILRQQLSTTKNERDILEQNKERLEKDKLTYEQSHQSSLNIIQFNHQKEKTTLQSQIEQLKQTIKQHVNRISQLESELSSSSYDSMKYPRPNNGNINNVHDAARGLYDNNDDSSRSVDDGFQTASSLPRKNPIGSSSSSSSSGGPVAAGQRKPFVSPQVGQQPTRPGGLGGSHNKAYVNPMTGTVHPGPGNRPLASAPQSNNNAINNSNMPGFMKKALNNPPGSNPNNGGSNQQQSNGQTSTSPNTEQKTHIGPIELQPDGSLPEGLQGLDISLVETVLNDMLNTDTGVKWDDIAGLGHCKSSIYEALVWPLQRPELFQGLRKIPSGILLFGPPGTGKTMLGKAIANQCQARFFSVSASSLTSKWYGQGEKLVKTLFAVCRYLSPCILFMDEVDSVLGSRSEGENDALRRLKTELLIQMDGLSNSANTNRQQQQPTITSDHNNNNSVNDINPDNNGKPPPPPMGVIVVAATNLPQELDDAARRRMTKRIYVPLPDLKARQQLIGILLKDEQHVLTSHDIEIIAQRTKDYSAADIKQVCVEAAYIQLRAAITASALGGPHAVNIDSISARPVTFDDFVHAIDSVKPSVNLKSIDALRQWNNEYGSFTIAEQD